jgi:hypothetical protein
VYSLGKRFKRALSRGALANTVVGCSLFMTPQNKTKREIEIEIEIEREGTMETTLDTRSSLKQSL